MTKIYLVRHCEAEGNIYRRAQGWYDGRISSKGARQIDALAERFRRTEPVDALYSSDLRRTIATAEAVTRYHDVPLTCDPRLREQRLGAWEDRPFGNLGWEEPEMMYAFNNDPARWSVPGGESFAHLQSRLRAAVTDIAARHPGQSVVCVSHGMAIRALLADALEIPSAEINAVGHGDNTAVSLLEVEGDHIEVLFKNNADHLTAALSTFSRQDWWRDPAKADANNVRFARLDPETEGARYLDFYRKSWSAVHGTLDGFLPEPYLLSARRHAKADPDALMTIVRPNGEVVGITELDTERGRDYGVGWICLCYVEEAYRRSLLGVQLIGHAVSLFRRLGRRAIQLNVYVGNTGAIRFYEACEFRPVGESEGVSGRLLVMEKEL